MTILSIVLAHFGSHIDQLATVSIIDKAIDGRVGLEWHLLSGHGVCRYAHASRWDACDIDLVQSVRLEWLLLWFDVINTIVWRTHTKSSITVWWLTALNYLQFSVAPHLNIAGSLSQAHTCSVVIPVQVPPSLVRRHWSPPCDTLYSGPCRSQTGRRCTHLRTLACA